ncbi:hypothetical protein OIU74_024732 [Salix koriyanagi]|uniref:Uncharacterized protein n=1 Tax=Salix koriyanagi TaxID=2511006 RepID=A0A9Q0W8J7_9ROSI|nr:hypothetical protein OIU74_024732 [Salix koriyanagi]
MAAYSHSTRDFNGLDIRFLNFLLRHSHSKHPILHRSLHLIHPGILRQPEPPQELATAPLDTVPRVILVLLLHAPLSADLKHPVILNLHLHLLLFKTRKIGLKNMGFRGLFPIDASVNKG